MAGKLLLLKATDGRALIVKRTAVPEGNFSVYLVVVLFAAVAILSGVLSTMFGYRPAGSSSGAAETMPQIPVTYYHGSIVPMSGVPMSPLQRRLTCDGCPPAESGSALLRDLAIANKVNLTANDLPAGWKIVGNPPKASGDVALGVLNYPAASRFIACMHARGISKNIVLYDVNQLINIGSTPFEYAESSPLSSGFMTLISWVDLVARPGNAGSEPVMQHPRLYARCSSSLWGALLSSGDEYPSNGGRGSNGVALSADAHIQLQKVNLPSPAYGAIMYVTMANFPYGTFLTFLYAERVYGSLTLSVSSPRTSTSPVFSASSPLHSDYTFLVGQLKAMAKRAIAAQGL